MKGMCAVVENGRTAVLYIYSVKMHGHPVIAEVLSLSYISKKKMIDTNHVHMYTLNHF